LQEERLAKVEGIVEQMDKRLNHIETDMREMRKEFKEEIDKMRKEFKEEIDKTRQEFRALFRLVIGLLVTTLAAVVGLCGGIIAAILTKL
jgi:F0F1-type ATP synthase membrane subunit b/b'